ncbi:MAG: hypothetical protein ABIH42_00385 [Planctomycetota bacterium]
MEKPINNNRAEKSNDSSEITTDCFLKVTQKTKGMRGGYFHYLFEPLIRKANYEIAAAGFNSKEITYLKSMDMHYVDESAELNIVMCSNLEEVFHSIHKEKYSWSDTSREIEITAIRLRVIGKRDKIKQQK